MVEDSASSRKMIVKLLAKENISHETAEDGAKAVARIQQGERFRLILMDNEMPNMGGVEATTLIMQLNQNLPVIGLTAHTDDATRVDFLNAGAVGMLSKPLKPKDVKALHKDYIENTSFKSTARGDEGSGRAGAGVAAGAPGSSEDAEKLRGRRSSC